MCFGCSVNLWDWILINWIQIVHTYSIQHPHLLNDYSLQHPIPHDCMLQDYIHLPHMLDCPIRLSQSLGHNVRLSLGLPCCNNDH